MDIQSELNTAEKCLIRVFFGYKSDWIKYLDRSTGLGSDWISQRKSWTALGWQKSSICSTLIRTGSVRTVVLKHFPLGRLWKSLLDLSRTSNKNLKLYIINVLVNHWKWSVGCLCLQSPSNLARICETPTPIISISSSGVTKGSSQGGKLSWRGPIDNRVDMQYLVPKTSYKLFHENSDVICFNWVNDFKVEIRNFMKHILSKIDTHQWLVTV